MRKTKKQRKKSGEKRKVGRPRKEIPPAVTLEPVRLERLEPQADEPPDLRAPGQAFWRTTLEEFQLEDFHKKLLYHAAQCLDRLEEARLILERDGLTSWSSSGEKVHPALVIEKDQKKLFAQLVRELRLDHDGGDKKEVRRPRLPEKSK